MKIAFVHDWFTMPAGAEKVAHEIIDLMQPSSVHCLFNFMTPWDLHNITQGKTVETSFIQNIPLADKFYRHLAPFFPSAISSLNVSDADVIISSNWAAAKGISVKPHQLHICYCHTPMRFAWDMRDSYLSKYGYTSGVKRNLALRLISRLRNWDKRTAGKVDHFIANSNYVAGRIQHSYSRKSEVIYPPVNTARFSLVEAKDGYYFTASRFVDYKNLELIIAAFNSQPEKRLVIAGTGPLERQLMRMAKGNITFVGWVPDDHLVRLMQHARAFVNASIEDFGIAGLEAQSCGTPVIALGIGGYAETVVEGKTGVFFHREHPEALADALIRFEKLEFDPFEIRRHAMRFDREVFRENFLNFFLDKAFLDNPSKSKLATS